LKNSCHPEKKTKNETLLRGYFHKNVIPTALFERLTKLAFDRNSDLEKKWLP